ncbi:MAG: hypothetical protein II317_03145 [Clostridia bacterium]|nr:hypothetical protein [Clostridia bacterium]
MITLTKDLNPVDIPCAELIKIGCLFDSYKDDNSVLFWQQNENDALISFTDGNMIIYNQNSDTEELKEFIDVISPCCIFSDLNTLKAIDRIPDEEIYIYGIKAENFSDITGDELSSKELYSLLDVDGLSLPEYPYFAVDYCRRLNLGFAKYFGISGKCAAISFNTGNFSIMNGIASHEKGYGSIALKAILSKNDGKDFLVCCRERVKPFYEKNGFKFLYKAGYWVKNK